MAEPIQWLPDLNDAKKKVQEEHKFWDNGEFMNQIGLGK